MFQISIVLPDTTVCPSEIGATFDDTDHYAIEQVSLSEFVDRHFIEAFVRRGVCFVTFHFYEKKKKKKNWIDFRQFFRSVGGHAHRYRRVCSRFTGPRRPTGLESGQRRVPDARIGGQSVGFHTKVKG